MGSRNKKKNTRGLSSSSDNKKRRKTKKRPASSRYNMTSRRNRVMRFLGDLKDMRKLSSNDEAFHLSSTMICDITKLIKSRTTPTSNTYRKWDEYARSFYLKLCTCFRVDYQHLEDDDDENGKKIKPVLPPTKEEEMLWKEQFERLCARYQALTEEKSDDYDKLIYEEERVECISGPKFLMEPFNMGSYSTGTKPDRIPYHLYLLVKEAVDIMKSRNNADDLLLVEVKIGFFCTYFCCHLPAGWTYDRASASSLIAGYDTMGGPKYLMDGYTPSKDWAEVDGIDPETYLAPEDIVNIMSIIHSRKTPSFWNMCWQEISFYCKLCSCFGLDYHCLEAASEDDVCLMNVGRNS